MKKSELIDEMIFKSQTEMALPTVRKKLTKMLATKKNEVHQSKTKVLENMAESGSVMAKTVI